MTHIKSTLILSTAAAMLFSAPAFAAEKTEKEKPQEKVVKVTATANTAVLSSDSDKFRVEDAQGNIFYNQLVPIDALQEVVLEADVVDTFTYEYQGRTYTNKIVR